MLRVKFRPPCGTPHFTLYTLHFTFFRPGGGRILPPTDVKDQSAFRQRLQPISRKRRNCTKCRLWMQLMARLTITHKAKRSLCRSSCSRSWTFTCGDTQIGRVARCYLTLIVKPTVFYWPFLLISPYAQHDSISALRGQDSVFAKNPHYFTEPEMAFKKASILEQVIERDNGLNVGCGRGATTPIRAGRADRATRRADR